MIQVIQGRTYGFLQAPPFTGPVYAIIRPGVAGDQWGLAASKFQYRHPWSVPGTFLNFYVRMYAPAENSATISWTDTTFELLIDDVATGLTVTVPAHAAQAGNGFASASSNTFTQVTIAAGQTVGLIRYGNTISGLLNGLGAHIMWSLSFSSTNTGESGYGCGAFGTALNNANDHVCPVLNGKGTSFTVATNAITNTTSHSIVPVAGNLFRIDAALETAPGVGAARVFLAVLNGVHQDGSGGTPDTRATISDTSTTGFSTFTLPLVPLDLLSVYELQPVTSPLPAVSRASCSVGFRATTDGESALCFDSGGGANPIIDGSTDFSADEGSGWAWTTAIAPTPPIPPASRWPAAESLIALPGGIDTFTLKGFCVNLSASPGSAKSYLFTTRKAFANAAPKLTMTGASGTDSVLYTDPDNGTATYSLVTDYLDISAVATGTPASAHVGWSWLMSTTATPPTPPVITTYPVRRLRRFMLPWDRNLQQTISRIEFIMQTGEGLVTGQGSDPVCMVRFSKDGGRTWGPETSLSIGQLGATMQRVYLNRPMGSSNNRQPVCELTVSDPVFTALLSCLVDQMSGTS